MNVRRDPAALLPLNEEVLWLLLSLHEGDRHGYALMRAIEERTDGRVNIQTGALYRFLHRMEQEGTIEEVAPPRAETDPRRRYYRITPFGRRVTAAELARMRRLLETAHAAGAAAMRGAGT
jgi:DNA-binding PadR family transcriptional regulator